VALPGGQFLLHQTLTCVSITASQPIPGPGAAGPPQSSTHSPRIGQLHSFLHSPYYTMKHHLRLMVRSSLASVVLSCPHPTCFSSPVTLDGSATSPGSPEGRACQLCGSSESNPAQRGPGLPTPCTGWNPGRLSVCTLHIATVHSGHPSCETL
jgi:hypothetical protein